MPTTPHQWHLFRRLEAAGCPIDWDGLAEPCSPLRVIHEPAALGTEIFPLGDRTALVFRVRIIAAVPFTISWIGLSTDWPRESLSLLGTQDNAGCFRTCCGGEVRLAARGLLNSRIRHRVLRRGEWISGYIALLSGAAAPPCSKKREATLWILDPFDRSYPYDLVLDNSQQIAGDGDNECRFLTADQLAQERAAYLEAEAAKVQRDAELKSRPKKSAFIEFLDQMILDTERENEAAAKKDSKERECTPAADAGHGPLKEGICDKAS